MSQKLDQADFDFLLNNARIGKSKGIPNFIHLDQPIGIWNYIRIANDIVKQLPAGAHMLDWGCGMGQMTYLLQQRDLKLTAYDVRPADARLPDTPLTQKVNVTVSQDPTLLPFDDATFDAVLSCGVLEHVDEFSQPGNEMKSLCEIHRILKPRAALLIYQLPQVHAWQEALIRRFKLGYSHPRRYTGNEIKRMLADTGYKTIHLRRANLIPKNLTGMPEALRKAYSAASRPLIAVDGVISQTPGLNALAGVLEVTAMKI